MLAYSCARGNSQLNHQSCGGLHNFLMVSQRRYKEYIYCATSFADQEHVQSGEWRREIEGFTSILPIRSAGSTNYTKTAKDVRDQCMSHFVSDKGTIDWQWNYVERTVWFCCSMKF